MPSTQRKTDAMTQPVNKAPAAVHAVARAVGRIAAALLVAAAPWAAVAQPADKLDRSVLPIAELTHLGLDPQPPPRGRAREAGHD
jgi:hypothetical protein